MKGILAAVAAALVFVGTSSAADKVDAAKLVGKWELAKSSDESAPKGATVEFTKDNKVTIEFKLNDKDVKLEGTYKVEGDKLTVKLSLNGKENEDSDTIKELTDDKLLLVDKMNKENEFKKKKK